MHLKIVSVLFPSLSFSLTSPSCFDQAEGGLLRSLLAVLGPGEAAAPRSNTDEARELSADSSGWILEADGWTLFNKYTSLVLLLAINFQFCFKCSSRKQIFTWNRKQRLEPQVHSCAQLMTLYYSTASHYSAHLNTLQHCITSHYSTASHHTTL